MMKNILRFLLVAVVVATAGILYSGCKRENSSPQWDVELLAPLIKSSLTADKILPDSLTHINPDGAVWLVYDHDVYSTPVDSVFKIKDTVLSNVFHLDVPFDSLPSLPFGVPANPFYLDLKSIELSLAIIKKGYIHLTLRNHLQSPLKYDFAIPLATLITNSFSYSKTLPSAPLNGVVQFDTLFDMSGYWLNLTGLLGGFYNRLDYSIKETNLAEIYHIDSTVLLADVQTEFKDMVPIYAKGYLGQTSVLDSATNNIGIAKHITDGMLLLDSATISFTIKNSVGVDAQATITNMTSTNSRTGSVVPLGCSAFINHTLNLNRATESGQPISVPNSTFYTVTIDNANSNIVPFLENLPDKISYKIRFNLNPLGDVSGHNDFIYTDSIFNANVKVNIPFRFAANQLTWVDTPSVSIKDSKAIESVGPSTLTLIADNGFPMVMDLQIYTLDKNGINTDSLLVPGTIAAAPIDANYRAIGKQRTTIVIPVSAARKANIVNAARMVIRARATTSSYPQVLQIYSDYSLDIKLIGDVTYRIQ